MDYETEYELANEARLTATQERDELLAALKDLYVVTYGTREEAEAIHSKHGGYGIHTKVYIRNVLGKATD